MDLREALFPRGERVKGRGIMRNKNNIF